jgi:hypothetical protein
VGRKLNHINPKEDIQIEKDKIIVKYLTGLIPEFKNYSKGK